MRKNGLLILLFMLYFLQVYSQKGGIVGFGGSINSTCIGWSNAYGMKELDNNDLNYYTPSAGWEAMFIYGYNLTDGFGIRIEFGESVQNHKYNNTESNSTFDMQHHYLQLPIMLRLATTGDKVKFHVMFGAQIGFLTKAGQIDVCIDGKENEKIINYKEIVVYEPGVKDITDRFNPHCRLNSKKQPKILTKPVIYQQMG